MYDAVTPVKLRSSPLIKPPLALLKFETEPVAVHGRSPARVSVIVMPPLGVAAVPKGALAVNSVPALFNTAVPSWNGVDELYGVEMVRPPAGIVVSMLPEVLAPAGAPADAVERRRRASTPGTFDGGVLPTGSRRCRRRGARLRR